jgi:hypothetical protein
MYDDFLKEKPKPVAVKKKPGKDLVWNLLTGVMLLMSLCACIFFFNLVRNPASSLNPFVPNTPVPPPATATWTPIGYAATWTPTVTIAPTDTNTPRPTYTVAASSTPFKVFTSTPNFTPTPILTSTRTPRPTGAPYSVTVKYFESTTFRADTSCNSFFVAGKVLGTKNTPTLGIIVKLGGGVPGKTLSPTLTTLTGITKVYGESGFEFDLKIAPVSSSQSLWIQIFDSVGAPLSEQFKLVTYADCKKNLILVTFQQK